jgi:DNA recombination-dependent growth factor C
MNLKNLTVLQLTDTRLENLLNEDTQQRFAFRCIPSHKESIGLVPIKDTWDEYLTQLEGKLWFSVNFHKRSVSKDKVKDVAHERFLSLVDSGEYSSVDSIDKETKEDIMDAVEASLLPDANYSNKSVLSCLNPKDNRLYVFSASSKEVDTMKNILIGMDVVEGEDIEQVQVDNLSDTMTSMLIDNSLVEPMEWGDKIILVGEDKSKGMLDKNSVEGKECHAMIEAGKMFTQGKFAYDGFITGEITKEFVFKGLSFDSNMEGEDEDDTLCKTLIYTITELSLMVKDLEDKLKDD